MHKHEVFFRGTQTLQLQRYINFSWWWWDISEMIKSTIKGKRIRGGRGVNNRRHVQGEGRALLWWRNVLRSVPQIHFSVFFSDVLLSFVLIMTKKEMCTLEIFCRCFRRLRRILSLVLAHQPLCKIYIKSGTWYHIFVILATFLYAKNCCINYVEAGTTRPKCLKLSSRAKNGHIW